MGEHHMKTEQEHLDVMRALVPEPARTRLLGLWTCAARSLGFLPAVLGARSLYWTVVAVETFVEEHYQDQIQRLSGDPSLPELHQLLQLLCADEVAHRRDAEIELFGRAGTRDAHAPGPVIALWSSIVKF